VGGNGYIGLKAVVTSELGPWRFGDWRFGILTDPCQNGTQMNRILIVVLVAGACLAQPAEDSVPA
jgi:hypothetical protein